MLYVPKTLRERCMTEKYSLAKGNFLDDFYREPSFHLVEDSILDLDNLSEVEKASSAAMVEQVCFQYNIEPPEWTGDERTFLKHPVFAMNAKGGLRLILIQESPKWFRSRNLFVSANCLERV